MYVYIYHWGRAGGLPGTGHSSPLHTYAHSVKTPLELCVHSTTVGGFRLKRERTAGSSLSGQEVAPSLTPVMDATLPGVCVFFPADGDWTHKLSHL